jgi:hypothetical protein
VFVVDDDLFAHRLQRWDGVSIIEDDKYWIEPGCDRYAYGSLEECFASEFDELLGLAEPFRRARCEDYRSDHFAAHFA